MQCAEFCNCSDDKCENHEITMKDIQDQFHELDDEEEFYVLLSMS